MAFFEEGTSTGKSVQVEAVPSYIVNYHEAALAVVAEGESNYNSLMVAIGLYENKSIRESGEAVYTEGAIGSFWEKVKKMFVAIIAKLKGIFNNFMSRFDASFKNGKSFFDKYKKQIAEKFSKLDKEKVKFVGYKFIHHDTTNSKLAESEEVKAITGAATMSDAEAQSFIDNRDKVEEKLEKLRGELIGGGSHTASEFNKELFQYFRSNENAKSEQDGVDFAYISKVLSNDKLSKTMSDSYKQVEKTLNDLIRACDKASTASVNTQTSNTAGEGEKSSASKKTSAYPVAVSIAKGCIAIKQVYLGAQMQAISDEIGQAKQFAAQVIRASVKESGSWEHYTEGNSDDFLGAVSFR